LTRIMNAMVIPRRTSMERTRVDAVALVDEVAPVNVLTCMVNIIAQES
jgi:hypothetical protein